MGRCCVKRIPVPVINFRKPVMYGAKFLFGLTFNIYDWAICLDTMDPTLKDIQLHPFNVYFDGLDRLGKFKAVQRRDRDPALPYRNTLSSHIFGN